MTIATSDSPSSLLGATFSYPSHEVTFVHSSRIASRLRAQGIPDFLIRHYALLTVTMHRSCFPTTTLRFSRDMPFALFACYAMICGSPALRDAYMQVLEMGSGARDPEHLQLVGDHIQTMLSTLEDRRHHFSPDILCGLLSYVGHFRSHLDDPVSFPLQNGAPLPLSRLARILSRNLLLQTVLAFFLALETPISLAMEYDDQFHLLPASIDSDFSTNVMVSNTPPFPPIGSTVYDYFNLGFRPLLLLHVDGTISLIRSADVLTLFMDPIRATLADSQIYSASMPPPPSYQELFQHTLDSLPADPIVFSHDFILQALQRSVTEISASSTLTQEDMHSLASHILSVRISSELSQHTHPVHELHRLVRPYRTYVFPPSFTSEGRSLSFGPCSISIHPHMGGQVGVLRSGPPSAHSLAGPLGTFLSLLAVTDTLRSRISTPTHLRALYSLSQEGSRVSITSFGSLLASTPPATMVHTESDQRRLFKALASPPYRMDPTGGLLEELLHFFSCLDTIPHIFPHGTMAQNHVVLVAFSPDPTTRPPEILSLLYFTPGSSEPYVFHFPLPIDASVDDLPRSVPEGFLHMITLSVSPSSSLLVGYSGFSFRSPSVSPPSGPAPPTLTVPSLPTSISTPSESSPPTAALTNPPVVPPVRYVVTDTTSQYCGLYISGVPRRASMLLSLDNLWNPLVALGLHEHLPGTTDVARRSYVESLLRPSEPHAPWASSYSLILSFPTSFSMADFVTPFTTPLSFAGRRDQGGVMNPTFTFTLLSTADFPLVTPRNELFLLRGPYVASLLDGLDTLSISVIVGHLSTLFPDTHFLGLRDFVSHRLTRGKKLASHSAWEPTVILYAPAEKHRSIIDTIRSMTLTTASCTPCFYRLVPTVGNSPSSLMQAKEPIMLMVDAHVRAEITLSTHTPDIRVLPHPDHGRLPAHYLSAPFTDTQPADINAAIERLLEVGALSEPWRYFVIDHRRRLFHGVWLLSTLPSHSSHCLYIATDFIPDNLRLLLPDLPALTLTPIQAHPILTLQNLDHNPLGVLTRALEPGHRVISSSVSAPAQYDHLKDTYLPTWADILHGRPYDHTLGMDRRLPRISGTPSSLSSSSTPHSIRTPTTTVPPSSAQVFPWSPREPDPSLATLTSWSSNTAPPTISNDNRLVPSQANPSQDDRMSLLLDQMTTLTQLVATLLSRIPPPSSPPDSK